MYSRVTDFQHDWQMERQATLKLFRVLTDESLNQRVTPEGRTLGDIAWHIVTTHGEMMGKTGLAIVAPEEEAPVPQHAADIVAAYERSSESVLEGVGAWSDEGLQDDLNMYGEVWKRGRILSVLIVHEIHHRAQMTVLMRQAGLTIPGIYGPAREEWAQMGLPAPR